MKPIRFEVSYTYAEDGAAPQTGIYELASLDSVLPTGLQGIGLKMGDGDTLNYLCAEGLFALSIKAEEFDAEFPEITNLVTNAESAIVDRLTQPVDPEWYTSVYGCLEAHRGKAITAEQALARISELLEPSREAIKRLGRLGNQMHNTQTPQPSGQAKAWAAELQEAAEPIRQIVGFPR